MYKAKLKLFQQGTPPTAIDRLLSEFGLFVEQDALRQQIKNAAKVFKLLLCMRRQNVKSSVDLAIHRQLVALSNEDYLAILYCLDDNLDAFKSRLQSPKDDAKMRRYTQ